LKKIEEGSGIRHDKLHAFQPMPVKKNGALEKLFGYSGVKERKITYG